MLMDRTCLAGALGSTLSRKHAYWTMDPPGVEPAGGGGQNQVIESLEGHISV